MIEIDLYEHLRELEIDIYPQKAKDNPSLPYMTYTAVVGRPRGSPSHDVRYITTSWQIDIYDDSSYKAKLLRELVVEKLRDFPYYNGDCSWRDGYEPRVKTFRQILEFKTKQYIGECNGN